MSGAAPSAVLEALSRRCGCARRAEILRGWIRWTEQRGRGRLRALLSSAFGAFDQSALGAFVQSTIDPQSRGTPAAGGWWFSATSSQNTSWQGDLNFATGGDTLSEVCPDLDAPVGSLVKDPAWPRTYRVSGPLAGVWGCGESEATIVSPCTDPDFRTLAFSAESQAVAQIYTGLSHLITGTPWRYVGDPCSMIPDATYEAALVDVLTSWNSFSVNGAAQSIAGMSGYGTAAALSFGLGADRPPRAEADVIWHFPGPWSFPDSTLATGGGAVISTSILTDDTTTATFGSRWVPAAMQIRGVTSGARVDFRGVAESETLVSAVDELGRLLYVKRNNGLTSAGHEYTVIYRDAPNPWTADEDVTGEY